MKPILGILAMSVLAAGGCSKDAPKPAASAERSFATSAVEVKEAATPIWVDGAVVGRSELVLASRLAAAVVEVRAVPGQTVRAGEILVRLEQGEADGAVDGARAAVAAADASLALARKNLSRYERLEGRGAAAPLELDRARQDEASASAAAAGARASLRRAETDRAQAVLVAPFDAVILEKLVSPGELASPGRPLVRLASTLGRRVEAAPGEQEAARLSLGDEVAVEIDGKVLVGRVAEIAGAVDTGTRRRTIRLDLPPSAQPPVGTFARLSLPGPKRSRLLVPERAVVARGGLELAWVAPPGGAVSLRYVRTGAREEGGLVEVRSGLEAGERVVLDPPADLEAGTRVAK